MDLGRRIQRLHYRRRAPIAGWEGRMGYDGRFPPRTRLDGARSNQWPASRLVILYS